MAMVDEDKVSLDGTEVVRGRRMGVSVSVLLQLGIRRVSVLHVEMSRSRHAETTVMTWLRSVDSIVNMKNEQTNLHTIRRSRQEKMQQMRLPGPWSSSRRFPDSPVLLTSTLSRLPRPDALTSEGKTPQNSSLQPDILR